MHYSESPCVQGTALGENRWRKRLWNKPLCTWSGKKRQFFGFVVFLSHQFSSRWIITSTLLTLPDRNLGTKEVRVRGENVQSQINVRVHLWGRGDSLAPGMRARLQEYSPAQMGISTHHCPQTPGSRWSSWDSAGKISVMGPSPIQRLKHTPVL